MAIVASELQLSISIPPARMFKAFVLDAHTLVTKIFPDVIKSVTFEGGDGGPGTIKTVEFGHGSEFNLVREIVDVLDKENFVLAYTVIEGEPLMNVFEKVSCQLKFEAAADGGGGSVCKRSSKSYLRSGIEKTEEYEKASNESTEQVFVGLIRAFEAYLLANPDVAQPN